ncbi:MAG: hypothetical protein E5299_02568 [Burkholderia gladioli]|nr:MAG: hypothetical protein E5299_02568 [Burkholderia gladioli]
MRDIFKIMNFKFNSIERAVAEPLAPRISHITRQMDDSDTLKFLCV